jgi:TolA-binding protein
MKATPDALEASVEAFARASAAATDGRATRARVLATAGLRLQRRARSRRAAVAALVVVAAGLSGSVAWTAIGRWRARTDLAPATADARARSKSAPARRTVAEAPPVDESAEAPAANSNVPVSTGLDAESRAYARAHEAHFVAGDPRAALAAWDHYLAAYPRGTFAPEARFNRALCLLRLGRQDAAREALRPFAAGRYRAREAAALIELLDARHAP